MKRILQIIILLTLALYQTSFASGLFFNVSTTAGQFNITTTIPNHFYPAAGILITSPGYSLKNPGTECTFAPNGYCLFPVSDTSPAHISINGAAGTVSFILCLNGTGPLSCQNYSANNPAPIPDFKFAYVTTLSGNQIILCSINQTTGALTNCAPTGSGFTRPVDITFNAAGTKAYVSDSGADQVMICNVNQVTGALSGCVDTGVTVSNVRALELNITGTRMYISQAFGNQIIKCNVDASSGGLSACTTAAPSFGGGPSDIVFNNTGSFVYVADINLFLCQVAANGDFVNCNGILGTITPSIALFASNTHAYRTRYAQNTVELCNMNAQTGILSACTPTGSGFLSPVGIAINQAETFSYIVNNTAGTVSKCSIDPTTKALSSCGSTGSGFTSPWQIVLQ